MVCGGKARDFFGEYMAGGLLVLLGMNSQFEGPLVGRLPRHRHARRRRSTCAARSSRGSAARSVGIFAADEEDMAELTPVLEDYCEALGMDLDEVLSVPFTKLVPVSHRPYGKLYTYL